MKTLALIMLLSSGVAHAWPTLTPFEEEPREKLSMWAFHRDGLVIPAGSTCALVLQEAAADLGRPLTHAEIEADLDEILALTGERLEATDAPFDRRLGFTGHARVRTPTGDRPIGNLVAGDEVLSYDIHRRAFFTSHVQHVERKTVDSYGVYRELPIAVSTTVVGSTLEPTGVWRGLGPEGRTFKWNGSEFEARQLGPLSPIPSPTLIFLMDLENPRHTFVIENILIH